MTTLDPGIKYRAEQAKRAAVTAKWLWEHPDTQGYIFDAKADDFGLDPWITIAGIDALTDGSKIILETGRAGERKVDPGEIVFVAQKDAPPPTIEQQIANRKHAVASAGYWFRAARTAQTEGKMAEALLCMENAYNHTENALVALRRQHGLPPSDER